MLFGPRLTNRVVDVAVNRGQGWQLHDYARTAGAEATAATLVGDRVPVYRLNPERAAWLDNLQGLGVNLLFLTTVHPGDRHAG